MNTKQFAEQVEQSFKRYFPNGYFFYNSGCLGNESIYFKCGMIKDIKDQPNQIRDNDKLHLSLWIFDNVNLKDDSFDISNTKLVIEDRHGACVYTNPPNSYYAMGRTKIPFRKMTNTPDKLLVLLDKFFKKARDIIKIEIDNNNLYNQKDIPQKYLDL